MHVEKVSDKFGTHFQRNFWLYIVTLLCLCTGIVLGIYTVKYMGDFGKTDLINYFVSFKESVLSVNINNRYIFFETIKNNIPVLFILWLLGLTIVGIPVILIINIAKGFTMGFTIAFVISGMGVNGIWMTLLGILPQNIIYIPCIVIASVMAMEFSLSKFKGKVGKPMSYHGNSQINGYTIYFLIILLAMFLGFIFESYLSPNLIKNIVIRVGSVVA